MLWFVLSGGVYVGQLGIKQTLVYDPASDRFKLTSLDGSMTEFDRTTRMFRKLTSPGGNTVEVTALAADDCHLATVERSYTSASNTTVEKFQYAYGTSTGDSLLTSITATRQLNTEAAVNLLRAEYAYYGTSDSFGGYRDLKTVITQAWDGSAWQETGRTLYRYYKAPSTDPYPQAHLLKFVVLPATYNRLVADSLDPLTISDAQLSAYADFYFVYDDDRRITSESVQGGSRTITFGYTASTFSNDVNHWKLKTVETLPDGNQNIVYSNFAGGTMLSVFQSGTSKWSRFYRYNGSSRVILYANPSAISGYDDTFADLLNYNSGAGTYQFLKDNDGLIWTYSYHATNGWLTASNLQKGQLGAAIKVREREYVSQGTDPMAWFQSKEILYPSDTDPTKKIETSVARTFYSGTVAVQQATTTLPLVSTGQNGSGTAATRRDYFDKYGNLTWTMNERGYIDRMVYQVPTGAIAQRGEDVNPANYSDAPSTWASPLDGGKSLITDFTSDDRGRITQVLGPVHAVDLDGTPGAGGSATSIRKATWTVYKESATGLEQWTGQGYQETSDSSFTLINPVSITKMDLRGRVNEQIQATRDSTSGELTPGNSFPQSSFVRWTTTQYTDCCFAASQRVYHTIPGSGAGSSGTNYDQTNYGYSVMKRQNRVVTPGGTITDTVFDARGNVLKTYVGTNDDGATENDPTGGGSDPDNNMVLIAQNQFDGGSAGGDGNLTQVTQYASASDSRVTNFVHDFRNRRTETDGEIDLCEKTTYDNLDRAVKLERFETTTSGNLIARTETKFDDRGRVFQTLRYAVNVSTGAVGNALTDNSWFDAAGNSVKQLPAGSSLFSKTKFDSLSRPIIRYSSYDLDETSYADAFSVTGDTILEQVETTFDNGGNAIQTTVRRRYHDAPDSETGSLTDPDGTPAARVTYMASYPDPLGRTIATADYGTNGGPALTRPATVPARSDNVLVSTTAYNSKGEAETSTDPAAVVTKTVVDAAGRETQRIGNYGTGTGSDANVTVNTAYTPDGNVASITAVNPTTGDQVTNYTYGTTLTDSDIATSTLKRYENYPDSTGGSDRVAFKYNRQSQVKELTDQNGTVHAFDFDKLARSTQDRITTVGTGIDSAVRRLATTYEVRGMRAKLTTYDNATVGSGSIVNEVQFAYNDFGQLITDYQSHSGAVSTSTTPKVQYGYANGSANMIRPTSLTYPNGRVISYDYGTAGGIPDAVSRIDAIKDGSLALAQYSYLGLGTFVITDYTEPDIKWTLADLTSTNDPDTGDIYSGFDRFGRVKDNRWYNYGSSADTDRIKYGYDRSSNRLWRENVVATSLGKAFDELYTYDGIHRLKDMQRGTLATNHSSLTTRNFEEDWSLDETGNWSNYRQDDDGDGSWDLIQNRANNTVNEITNIMESTGPSWITPAYDAAGNMTTIPKPANPTVGYTGIYDAWNRLTAIKEGGDFVAEYAYDPAKRRTIQKSYTSGVLSETRHIYYTEPKQWQVAEERVGSSSNAERQFVWGRRYVDDLVLRDRDSDGNGSLDERLYSLQDANWNVTAVTNASSTVQERYAYTAYGVPIFLNASFGSRGSSSYQWETLYAGYRWDSIILAHLARHRWLYSIIGQWGCRDPVGMSAGINLYEYVASTPLRYVDPLGLEHPIGPKPPPPLPPPFSSPPTNVVNVKDEWSNTTIFCRCPVSRKKWLKDKPLHPVGVIVAVPAPIIGVGSGNGQFGTLPPPGQFFGSGGADSCVAVVIKCGTNVAVFHLQALENASQTLGKYTWPAGCHAIVCGGDDTRESNCLMTKTIGSLSANGITLDGVADSSG